MRRLKILILGGTAEASALARALAGDMRFEAMLSLAGRTKAPVLPPLPCRIGGFGGVAGLGAWLRENATDALIDATHPFAATMTDHAHHAASACGVPMLRIDRPAWQPDGSDRWVDVPDMQAAVAALGTVPRRVFLTIGHQELAPFCYASWHDYLIRSVDAPDADLCPSHATIITARGPFDEASELELMQTHRIDILVTKNSGAVATGAKLVAARHLGLPVIMVARPPAPMLDRVADVVGALDWLTVHHVESIRRGV